jgi:uncharacterized protein (DUF302 family)
VRYYLSKTLRTSVEAAIARLTEALQVEGLGVLTEIDAQATLKQELDVEFRPYRILGACNPQFANQMLQVEEKIGTMLPCNIVVQEKGGGEIQVVAIDPVISMQVIGNSALSAIARQLRKKLWAALRAL